MRIDVFSLFKIYIGGANLKKYCTKLVQHLYWLDFKKAQLFHYCIIFFIQNMEVRGVSKVDSQLEKAKPLLLSKGEIFRHLLKASSEREGNNESRGFPC